MIEVRSLSVPAKRNAPSSAGETGPPEKKGKWTPEEDQLAIELRRTGMKWDDIAKRLPGRSAISCRLRYQNYSEKRQDWDEEKKNKLARLYNRFKQAMWEMVAKEMGLPWRAIEGIHWEMGREEMASRANVPVFQPHAGGAMPRTQSSPGPRTTPNLAPAPETPGDSSGGDQRAASEFSNHSPPELSNRSPPLALNRSPPHQAPNRTPPSISNRSPRAASGRTPRLRSTSTGTVNRRRRRSTNTRRDAPPQLAPVTESGPPVPQTSTFSPSYSDVPTPLSSAMDWNGSPATRPTADDRLPLPPLHLRRPSPELVYQPPPIPPVPRLPPQYRREDT